jgi:ferredoxin
VIKLFNESIIIDTYLCSGCGACIEICPEVFRLDALTDKAALAVLEPVITEAVLQAISFCPEKCIAIG